MATTQQASFAINLEDNTSGSAESAASALRDLKEMLHADTAELRELQKAMKNLQQGTSVNITQFRDLKARIDAKKTSIASAQSSYLALGGTFSKTSRAPRDLASRFAELQKAAGGLPGPLGGLLSKLGGLRGVLIGGALAVGVLAIAAALGALAVASVAAGVALLRYGVAQADARRSELLHLEALTKLRNWYGIAAGSATELQSAIDGVSAGVSIGRAQVAGYAEQLYRSHLRGQNLKDALEGASIAASALGENGAKRFMGMAAAAALSGRSVRALADDYKARFGPIVARQMLSLDVQARKLREGLATLFSGLRIEGLLRGLSTVTGLFSTNAAVGRALKAIFETVFNPILDGAEPAGLLVKRVLQGMILAAQNVVLAYHTVRLALKRAFGGSDLFKGFDGTRLALEAGKVAAVLFFGALFVGVGLLVSLLVPLAAVGGALFYLGKSFLDAFRFGRLLFDTLTSFGEWLGSAAYDLVNGLVAGIQSGLPRVVSAVRGLASGAMKAFKSALGIASPSKAFSRFGLNITQGVEGGISEGGGRVDRAVSGLVEIPTAPGAPAGGASVAGGGHAAAGASLSVVMGDLHVHSSGTNAAELAGDIRAELHRVLEGLAIQLGAPVT